MRISAAFPSKYLKASDLDGRNIRVLMERVEIEDIGDDNKPILYFQGKEKGMVLNKTNATNISLAYGDDTENWRGKEVVLFEAMVDFQGKTVAAIRVRPPTAKDRQTRPGAYPDTRAASPQRSSEALGGDRGEPAPARDPAAMDEDIPF